MQDDQTRIRVGGILLAMASVLMIGALVVHGPIAAEPSVQMARISSRPFAWSLAHWLAAAALSLYAVAGLVIVTARSVLTAHGLALSAWGVVFIGGLWTLNTAVVEATVVSDAATAGLSVVFDAWMAYAEGNASGFAFVALALAVIASNDARDASGVTPSWAGWLAMIAGTGSFTGWALGMWVGVAGGNLLWIASSILVSVWSAWFGIALARSPADSISGEQLTTRPVTV